MIIFSENIDVWNHIKLSFIHSNRSFAIENWFGWKNSIRKLPQLKFSEKGKKKSKIPSFSKKKFLRISPLKYPKMNLKQRFYQVSASASEIGST
jgi:hypothetical protein